MTDVGTGVDAAQELVLDALRRGVPAVLDDDGDDDTGGEPGHGDDLAPYGDEEAWAGRTIGGRWLADVLCGGDELRALPRAVVLRGARILGGLPLDGAELPFRLELLGCQLGDHPIELVEARTRTVRLPGVRCGGIAADRAHMAGALLLPRASVHGEVRLIDARIDASVKASGATLVAGAGGIALDADRAHIGGSLTLREGFRATGEIQLEAATIGGDLDAGDARLSDPGGRPLSANGAQVAVSVFLNGRCTVSGPVEMYGIRIGRDLICSHGRFENPGGDALALNGAEVGGKLMLRRATVRGRVRINNGSVGGDLVAGGADLDSPATEALSASRATFGGHVLLDDKFAARGEIRLIGATIAGSLRCSSARLTAPRGVALDAESAAIGEAVSLTDGFTATGTLQMSGISVGAAFDAAGARLDAGGPDRTVAAGPAMPPGPTSSAGGGNGDGDGPTTAPKPKTGAPGDPGMALDLRGARVTGSVNLVDGFASRGEVRLTRTTVGGHLDCSGATFAHPGGVAIRISGARISGGIYFERDCDVDGQIRLPGTTIGRDFQATRGRFHNPGGAALHMVRAQVTGDLVLGRGLTTTGGVLLVRAGIGGNLDCAGGTFSHRGLPALDLPHAEIGGRVVFDEHSRVTGRVHLGGAVVGGSVDLDRARIANDEDVAVTGTSARVSGGFAVQGEVTGGMQLRGIVVGGDLDCRGAHLVGTAERPALAADRAQITGGLMLGRGFRADGKVQLRSCEVGGHTSCVEGTFSNPGDTALTLGGARIGSDLGLDRGFAAEGSVRLGKITIGSDLICTGGTFSAPGAVALRLSGAHITGGVWLDGGFSAQGTVELIATTVGGDVRGESAELAGFPAPDGVALDASGARIAGSLSLCDGFRSSGAVVLRNATVGTLHDDAAAWPDRLDLDGFRYERLTCPPADRGWRARSGWLRRQRTPSALGYVQLAAVYRAAGDELWARRVLIDRYNALLRPPAHWSDQLPRGPRSSVWRAWRWVLRLTIGHGFSPARSLVVALPFAIALALWLGHAADSDMLIPIDETALTNGPEAPPRSSACDERYPCVQPAVYALDNLVPIVDLGQRSRWSPDQSHRGSTWLDDGRWLSAATWTTSVLGWVLATLVAASFTQIIRRE